MKCRMRHDHILVHMVNIGKVGRIHMPDSAVGGKEFVVESIGPEVKDLEVGDKVLLKGTIGADYYVLPNDSTRIVISEENAVLVFVTEESDNTCITG